MDLLGEFLVGALAWAATGVLLIITVYSCRYMIIPDDEDEDWREYP